MTISNDLNSFNLRWCWIPHLGRLNRSTEILLPIHLLPSYRLFLVCNAHQAFYSVPLPTNHPEEPCNE